MNKEEVWMGLLVGEDRSEFFKRDWFLRMGRNWQQYAENNVLHFTHIGAVPVVKKNATYPLSVAQRTDTADDVSMAYYSTDATRIPDVDLFALPYDKKDSILADHRTVIQDEIASEGIWNVSPFEDTSATPIVEATTGTDLSDGHKPITRSSIATLRKRVNIEYPGLKNRRWVMIMDPVAFWNLIDSDTVIAQQMGYNQKLGEVGVPMVKIYGFEIYEDARVPYYDGTTKERKAFGSVIGGTDLPMATVFVADHSFGLALGETKPFIEVSATYQAEVISFKQHAIISPLSSDLETNLKYVGGILRT